MTAKETITPLILDEAAGDVLLLLAQNDLPVCHHPDAASQAPPARSAWRRNVALGNAEIIGAFTAIHAACPGANLVGGVISGTFNMRTTQAVFASPEFVLQDLGLAEIDERLYGFDFGAGGYIDAKYPGAQIMLEVFARFSLLARSGRYNVPAGLLNSGKRFSPVQAMLDIEVERWTVEAGKGIQVSQDSLLLEQIRRVGIGGHSLAEDHTLENMRKNIWYPQLMDHTSPGLDQEHVGDMVAAAGRRVEKDAFTERVVRSRRRPDQSDRCRAARRREGSVAEEVLTERLPYL